MRAAPSRNGCSAAASAARRRRAGDGRGRDRRRRAPRPPSAVARRASPPGRSPHPGRRARRAPVPARATTPRRALAGRRRATRRQLDVPGAGQLLEAIDVDRVRRQVEPVPGVVEDELGVAGAIEHPAQPRDVALQRAGGRGGGRSSPHQLDELIGAAPDAPGRRRAQRGRGAVDVRPRRRGHRRRPSPPAAPAAEPHAPSVPVSRRFRRLTSAAPRTRQAPAQAAGRTDGPSTPATRHHRKDASHVLLSNRAPPLRSRRHPAARRRRHLPHPQPRRGQPGTYVFVNSMVILAEQPVIVDCGAPLFRERWLDAVTSLVDPADVRWVFLSHDDGDHIGNLADVLALAPNATVVANFFSNERVRIDRPGEMPIDRQIWLEAGGSLRRRRSPAAPVPSADLRRTDHPRPVRRAQRRDVGGRLLRGADHRAPSTTPSTCRPTSTTDHSALFNSLVSPWHQWLDARTYPATSTPSKRSRRPPSHRRTARCCAVRCIADAFDRVRAMAGEPNVPPPGQETLDALVAQALVASPA